MLKYQLLWTDDYSRIYMHTHTHTDTHTHTHTYIYIYIYKHKMLATIKSDHKNQKTVKITAIKYVLYNCQFYDAYRSSGTACYKLTS